MMDYLLVPFFGTVSHVQYTKVYSPPCCRHHTFNSLQARKILLINYMGISQQFKTYEEPQLSQALSMMFEEPPMKR